MFYFGLFVIDLYPCVHERCVNRYHFAAISSIFDFVSNFLIVVTPFKAVLDLSINAVKRRRIMYVFAIVFM